MFHNILKERPSNFCFSQRRNFIRKIKLNAKDYIFLTAELQKEKKKENFLILCPILNAKTPIQVYIHKVSQALKYTEKRYNLGSLLYCGPEYPRSHYPGNFSRSQCTFFKQNFIRSSDYETDKRKTVCLTQGLRPELDYSLFLLALGVTLPTSQHCLEIPKAP